VEVDDSNDVIVDVDVVEQPIVVDDEVVVEVVNDDMKHGSSNAGAVDLVVADELLMSHSTEHEHLTFHDVAVIVVTAAAAVGIVVADEIHVHNKSGDSIVGDELEVEGVLDLGLDNDLRNRQRGEVILKVGDDEKFDVKMPSHYLLP